MSRDFRKIVAWQKADALVMAEYRASASGFPRDENYGLRSHIRSAAVSIAANIAEGSGLRTPAGLRRFLYHAQGSLSEVKDTIHLAANLGYFDSKMALVFTGLRAEVGRPLRALIRAVDHQIASWGPGDRAALKEGDKSKVPPSKG